MPIYAYRCAACGHTKDLLRKLSDPPLADCPACGEPRFEKQVTAAGFQLKGSGWYATDFRNPPAKPAAGKPEAGKPETGKPETGKPDAGKSDVDKAGKGAGNGTPAPAASPAVTPSAAPAASPAAAGSSGTAD
jgi:putative FmdB family regulatory protein